MTHAFFKALLFLGSGSVIHGMSGEQDMRKMGGLRTHMPWTHRTMLVGCIAIAGFPPFAASSRRTRSCGRPSSWAATARLVWAVGFVAAGLTAFYMFRLYHMTFGGSFRGTPEQEHHLHESPPSMVVPLQVLALGSIVAGFLGVPAVLGGWLRCRTSSRSSSTPLSPRATARRLPLTRTGTASSSASWPPASSWPSPAGSVATRFYDVRPDIPARLAEAWSGTHRVLFNKYYVDEIYDALFVQAARPWEADAPSTASTGSWSTEATARSGRGSASTASPG